MNRLVLGHTTPALAAFTLGMALAITPARADESLRPFLQEKVEPLRKVLAELKLNPPRVSIGTFGTDARHGSHNAAGINALLTQILEAARIEVSTEARYELKGEYYPRFDPMRSSRVAQIILRMDLVDVDDANRRVMGTFPIQIREDDKRLKKNDFNHLVAYLLPQGPPAPGGEVTIASSSSAAPVTVKAHWNKRNDGQPGNAYTIDKDSISVVESADGVEHARRYTIQVGTKTAKEFHPLPMQDRDGKAFVDVNGVNEITVRVTNHTRDEVALELLLDGVSMCAFSNEEHNPPLRHVIIPPQSVLPHVDILGWYYTRDISRTFRLVDFDDNLAASRIAKARPESVGLITAQFRACSEHKGKDTGETADRILGVGREVVAKYELKERYINEDGPSLQLWYRRADAERHGPSPKPGVGVIEPVH